LAPKIGTWNVQRPRPGGTLNPRRIDKIREVGADIWVLTETRDVIHWDDSFHSLSTFPIPNYHGQGETLVTIWSRWPMRPVSVSRFTVCAEIVEPKLSPLLIYGTVIPWDKDEGFCANVKPGRWEEHRRQVKVQANEWEVLARSYPQHRMCIAGDFNQHRGSVGAYRDPESVDRVSKALASSAMTCLTQDRPEVEGLSKPLVDHICISDRLVSAATIRVYPYDEIPSAKLSDHHMVVASFELEGRP